MRQFIRANIDSVEMLRVLLLLRSRRERDWSVEAISDELRSSPAAIRRRLDRAVENHLAVRHGATFRYQSGGPGDASLAAVGKLYRERRATVVSLIFMASGE